MSVESPDLERLLREEKAAAARRERELLLQLVALQDGLDRLERALVGEELCGKAASVAARFGLVRRRLASALEREGVARVDSVGQLANSEIHEIVDVRTSSEPSGTILEVDLDAFLHKGSVLRAGRVIVSDGDTASESPL